MSLLRRIWQSLRNPAAYVGRDLEGNKFYEYLASSSDSRRSRRVVEYRHPNDMWNYIGGGKRLPVQWSSWLSHTRHHPPTLEELQADFERQERVKANAAIIEARDNEDRARMITEGAAVVGEERESRMNQILHDGKMDTLTRGQAPSHEDESEKIQRHGQDERLPLRKDRQERSGPGQMPQDPPETMASTESPSTEWVPLARHRGNRAS